MPATVTEILVNDKIIEQSGHFLYPKNGCMGWHTNSNVTVLRCYTTYSENG